jgi:isoleucyl-tRNA synthetase
MISRLARLEQTVDAALGAYDATAASRAIIEFVDDDVANWYVRLSRGRFYDVEGGDNRAAFATLHEVLSSVCRLLAPIAPFVSDWIHRELTGESVHLAPFVAPRAAVASDLDAPMAAIRTLARLGRAAREEIGIKVRRPLARMVCVAPGVSESALIPLVPLLASELNVKRVDFATSADELVTLQAKPEFRVLGKRFGKKTPLAAQATSALTSEQLRAFEHGAPLVISVEGQSHELTLDDLTIIRRASGDLVVQEDAGFFAAIDPAVTPDLELEGYARELVSRVQRMRKEASFAVSDRITLTIEGGSDVHAVVRAHRAWIADETLATDVVLVDQPESGATHDGMTALDLDGMTAFVAITRIP